MYTELYPDERPDDRYDDLLLAMQGRINKITVQGRPLFLTATENGKSMNEIYLENIPDDVRSHYNCCMCRHFLNRYGSLVAILPDGTLSSALWDEETAPPFFFEAVRALRLAAEGGKITYQFFAKEQTLGTPISGGYRHFSVRVPSSYFPRGCKFSHTCAAESRENFLMLRRATEKYTIQDVARLEELLLTDTLHRASRFLPQVKKFHELLSMVSAGKRNLIWAYAAADPAFSHISSTVVGAALDSVAAGSSVSAVTFLWNSMLDPCHYMRAQTAPTQNNIDRAEQIVAQLGIADSLQRRYATLGDIPQFLWKPSANTTVPADGVFSHLTPKNKPVKDKMAVAGETMTWSKFSRTLLPLATKIEALTDRPDRFVAMTTAENPASKNILRWGNPFAWYYAGGLADGEMKRRVEESGGRYENCELRCSLAWEGGTDLDIHCVTPSGRKISFSNKRVGNGWLDIDANGGYITSMMPVENIRWVDGAPDGIYRFYVHNFCERGTGTTPFTVELQAGADRYIYNGIAGATGYQQDVFVFRYENGKITPISGLFAQENSKNWNVPARSFVDVTGIVPSPNVWGSNNPLAETDANVFFLLKDCFDSGKSGTQGFFPEMLIPELHEVRRTISAYCDTMQISGADQASACGLGFHVDQPWDLTLRVTTPDSVRIVKIDRME